LKRAGKLLGKIFGLMFPTVFGCRTHHELTRVRNWDKNLPGQILGALPKQKWLRQLQHRGQDLLASLWRQVEDKSPATRSRWQWTWVGDVQEHPTAAFSRSPSPASSWHKTRAAARHLATSRSNTTLAFSQSTHGGQQQAATH
jgi:hypothetical protein